MRTRQIFNATLAAVMTLMNFKFYRDALADAGVGLIVVETPPSTRDVGIFGTLSW